MGKQVHGDAGKTRAPEYTAWRQLRARCHNARHPAYSSYGMRGIKVCERWRSSYQNFLEDMGRRPSPAHSIERKDNNGDYTPDNCTWATAEEQQSNKRNTRRITFQGRTRTLAQWARLVKMRPDKLHYRLEAGWSLEKALTLTPQTSGPRSSHILVHQGRHVALTQLASENGIKQSTLRGRLKRGLPLEQALKTNG